MRLMTTIEARRSAGEAFVFQADAHGALVCEIADSLLIQTLLRTGNFCVLDAGAEPERKVRVKLSKALQEVALVRPSDGDLV